MKIAAILLSAGNGERFNSKIPKQYHTLSLKKIYRYPLDLLESCNYFSEIILVIGKRHEEYLDPHKNLTIIIGGETRQQSVLCALQALHDIDFVIICEGVRPFLTKEMIKGHIKKLKNGARAVNTCIPCNDTINIQKKGKIIEIPPRELFLRGQTPQSFSFTDLLDAHLTTTKQYTDDCSLMLDYGKEIAYILGSKENIKITSEVDMKIAIQIIS